MTQAFHFEVNIKIWPFYCMFATHPYVEHVSDRGILHPWNAII